MTTPLAALAIFAAAPAAAQESAADYRSHLDQAALFVRREWFEDAERELVAAVATPDGALDAEAWFLLAQVRFRLADLPGAREAADRALVQSSSPAHTAQAAELLAWFDAQFGWVDLEPARAGVRTRLELALRSVVFDPELKDYVRRLQARSTGPVPLPTRLGLPAGTWSINGTTVEVAPGATTTLQPPIVAGGPLGAARTEVGLGLGLGTWLGPEAGHLLPAPAVQVELSQSWGVAAVTAFGEWSPQPFSHPDGLGAGVDGVGVGGRLGVDVASVGPLTLRPAAGYRFARVPGQERICALRGSVWWCGGEAAAGDSAWRAYPAATAHVVSLELGARRLARRDRGALVAGIRVAAELGLGRLPERLDGAGSAARIALEPDATAWRAPGLRVLVDLAYAP